MRSGRRILLFILSGGLLGFCIVGCERDSVTSTPAPATSPADPPAATGAATEAIEPRVAVLMINGQRVEFPPAKLALRAKGGQVLALLYSDDPPSALEDSYRGNSFYLEMVLDISEVDQLDLARWDFNAPNSDRADTVTGIWLDGRAQHLQPSDVGVEFGKNDAVVKVWLGGSFLLFEAGQEPTIPGRIVPVTAELDAEILVKTSRGG